MSDPVAGLVVELLQANGWMVWTFLGGTLLSVFFRSAYPEPADRPRWMVGLLAVCDLLAVNLGSFVSSARRIARKPD